MLLRHPVFSLTAIVTLALGIAAAAVVFSLAYGLLLSPLPYSNARRLVFVWEFDRMARGDPGEGFGPIATVTAADFASWQRETHTLESLDALTFGFYSIVQGASPTEVIGGRVTRPLFSTLGVRPILGRTFAPADPDDVVVLGYGLWQTQYGGDRAIIGRQILLNDRKYTVVGVLPPEFFFYIREFALWTPLDIRSNERRPRPVMGVGLLRRGGSVAETQAEFDTIASRLERENPAANKNRGARVMALREQYSRFFRPTVMLLLAAVGFLISIACANVASLVLARTAEREREMAVRVALGATRLRIIRQLLGESLALSLAAGSAGVAVALILVPMARTLLPMSLPIPLPGIEEIAVSAPVLSACAVVSTVTVLLFGLAPALRSSRPALNARATSPGVAQGRLLDSIVVVELALSVLLLTLAGTAMRSVYVLYHHLGFRADHVLTFRTPVGPTPPERLVQLYTDIVERLRTAPGVRGAAAAYSLPGSGGGGQTALFAEGVTSEPNHAPRAATNAVSGDFFGVLGIPLISGRTFSARDGASSADVVILSAGLSRKLFGNDDPIGRRVRIEGQSSNRWLNVVGIVGDVRPMLSEDPGPVIYRPFTQNPPGAIGFVVKTFGSPMDIAPAAEKLVWEIRPSQPITYVGTLERDLDEQGFRERLSAVGLGWFGGCALVLASIGLYGLIGYVVKQRVKEFGIRLAIGASPKDVIALVLRRGMVLISLGLLLGAGVSAAATSVLKSVLYGIKSVDVPTGIAAAALLGGIGLAACYLPARKAAATDPMAILRSE
jgi:putative ABC transport system permease protein